MPKLKSIVEANKYSSYRENWELSNGLLVSVDFSGDNCVITVYSDSGDVTDQVHERFKDIELYQHLKLLALTCYHVELSKSLLKDFFIDLEDIDINLLNTGKTY